MWKTHFVKRILMYSTGAQYAWKRVDVIKWYEAGRVDLIADRAAARPDCSNKVGPKVASLNSTNLPDSWPLLNCLHSIIYPGWSVLGWPLLVLNRICPIVWGVFLCLCVILYPSVSPSSSIRCPDSRVILIWSRYCVLNIPPCEETSYCSFSESFLLHSILNFLGG